VILVDPNILIYSHVKSFAQHELARRWLDQQLSGSTRVGLPWASLLAFLRLVTNPAFLSARSQYPMLGVRCATGSLVNRYGYRTRPSATLICWVSFSLYPACTLISCRMPIWLRSRSNMGSRCIRPMAILRDFQNCVGQIRLALDEGIQ
jgi:hypothetical protein